MSKEKKRIVLLKQEFIVLIGLLLDQADRVDNIKLVDNDKSIHSRIIPRIDELKNNFIEIKNAHSPKAGKEEEEEDDYLKEFKKSSQELIKDILESLKKEIADQEEILRKKDRNIIILEAYYDIASYLMKADRIISDSLIISKIKDATIENFNKRVAYNEYEAAFTELCNDFSKNFGVYFGTRINLLINNERDRKDYLDISNADTTPQTQGTVEIAGIVISREEYDALLQAQNDFDNPEKKKLTNVTPQSGTIQVAEQPQQPVMFRFFDIGCKLLIPSGIALIVLALFINQGIGLIIAGAIISGCSILGFACNRYALAAGVYDNHNQEIIVPQRTNTARQQNISTINNTTLQADEPKPANLTKNQPPQTVVKPSPNELYTSGKNDTKIISRKMTTEEMAQQGDKPFPFPAVKVEHKEVEPTPKKPYTSTTPNSVSSIESSQLLQSSTRQML